jgi:hypothetical protein
MQSYTLSRAPQLYCPLAVMHNRGVFVNAKGDVSRATFGCALTPTGSGTTFTSW